MTKRAIVIAGLVRAPERFQGFLSALFPLAAANDIEVIISTWVGELQKYPEILSVIQSAKATIIDQEEPNCILPGHALHQIFALDAGLSLLNDDVFVLRLRPDLANLEDVVAFSEKEPETLTCPASQRCGFSHKIYINANIMAHPFYINDICFAGLAGNLRQLANLPFLHSTKYTRMAPEQLIWGTPFITQNTLFDQYFRTNVGLIFNDEAMSARSIDCMKGSSLYTEALAGSIHILSELFANLRDKPDLEETAGQCEQFALEDILWGDVQQPWARFHRTAVTAHIHDTNVANALVLGRFAGSEFGDRFRATMEKVVRDDGATHRSRADIDSLILASIELAESLEAKTSVRGFRVVRFGEGKRYIAGMRPSWKFVGERTPREAELEDEVNRLRRVVDSLSR